MAAVLPHRPNTNSSGASSGPRTHTRHASSNSNYPHHQSPDPSSISKSASQTHLRPSHVPLRSKPRQRAVKSQYPPESTENHVEYILLASFDIDRGSVMEHQYPAPVGGDEHMLAELMLPDGAHVRAQDWTIFFLHKDGAVEDDGEGEDEEDEEQPEKKRRKGSTNGHAEQGAGEDESEDGSQHDEEGEGSEPEENVDGPPLVYVLNLVNMKQDKTVKRGAVVKAMAICTRHSFLHIYKPLLLLALQHYFANPVIETLASLYEAVNSMDLSLLPKLSYHEKFILQSSDAKDLFLEKFEAIISQRMAANDREQQHQSSLSPPSPTTQSHLRNRYGLPRDTHEFESVVKYDNVPVPIKVPVAVSAETVGDFSLIKLITTFSAPHTSSPVPFSPTHPHLTTNGTLTHPIIVLLNALLTQKRIIFLGHNLPSSDVAEAVLGACSLASGGLLRGFTRHAFPYTDLTKIDDLLKVPGFIAGVTNPAFAHKTEWWDLLCDLSTGRMRISNTIEQAPLTEGVSFFHQSAGAQMNPGGISAIVAAGASMSAGLGGSTGMTGTMHGDVTGDMAFMQNVNAAINERHGENAIRAKFRRWVLKFTRIAGAFEEVVYGATSLYIQPASPKPDANGASFGNSPQVQPPSEIHGHGYVWPSPTLKSLELAANATRIEGWRNTRSYYNFIQDLAAHHGSRAPVRDLDLQHLHDKLAKLRLHADISANIYLAICGAVNSEAEICQLLATILSSSGSESVSSGMGAGQPGGLFTLALGLFHPRVEVREQVAGLMERVREHEAGKWFWRSLGRFVKIGFERVVAARDAKVGVAGLGVEVG